MFKCATCDGTAGMIEMNDDGETFTLHINDTEGNHHEIKIDRETLDKFGDAVKIRQTVAELEYEIDGEG